MKNKNKAALTSARCVSIADVAAALGINKRNAERRATNNHWPYVEQAALGGRRRLYEIARLPAETQAALAARALKTDAGRSAGDAGLPDGGAGSTPDPRAESLAAAFDVKSGNLKAVARERLGIVREYFSLLGRGFTREHVETAVTRERGIALATLGRYLGLVAGKPEQLWLHELCPAYAGRTALAAFSAEAWESIKADFLRPERPTFAGCYFRLKRAAPAHGWTIPSEKTIKRRVDQLPRAVKVLAREGKRAALALYPAQVRSRAALSALMIVNADGYKHNVWVRFPDGEICRPKSWCWQDVYSSKALAWRTDKTEHTDVIRLSLGDVVERYGIPERALLDNTMAAANKTMSGGARHRFRFKVQAEEPLGVFRLLGMEDPIWATPRHGQAKPIERIFGIGGLGEIVDKHPALAGAWTGSNTSDKPEYAEGRRGKNRVVELEEFEELLAREIEAFNAKPGRRGMGLHGRSFDEVFNESYARSTIRRATEAQRRLWLLATEPVTAGRRDGAIVLDAGRISRTDAMPMQANRYWHRDLVDFGGRQVVARFDPQQLHKGVHVYTLDGRWICYADCIEAQGFADQDAGREHQRARSTFVRGAKLQLAAEVRMSALEASKFQPGAVKSAAEATIPSPKVVRAAFRDPIERPRIEPRPLTAAEQPYMAEAEALAAAPAQTKVADLRGDAARHNYWLALDARRRAGETLSDEDEQFWKKWPTNRFFRIQTELDQEFQQRIATGG